MNQRIGAATHAGFKRRKQVGDTESSEMLIVKDNQWKAVGEI